MRSTGAAAALGNQLGAATPPFGTLEQHEEGQERDDDRAEDRGCDALDRREGGGRLAEHAIGVLPGGGAAHTLDDLVLALEEAERAVTLRQVVDEIRQRSDELRDLVDERRDEHGPSSAKKADATT